MAATGGLESALEVFEEMRASSCRPSVVTYNSLLDACEKSGNSEKAMQLLDEMFSESIKPDLYSYGSVISCCGK
ncbi:unnamed protein product, partial [Discosporangium mesarthrocarpum]